MTVMLWILCDGAWLRSHISSPSLVLLHQHVSQMVWGIKNMRGLWSFWNSFTTEVWHLRRQLSFILAGIHPSWQGLTWWLVWKREKGWLCQHCHGACVLRVWLGALQWVSREGRGGRGKEPLQQQQHRDGAIRSWCRLGTFRTCCQHSASTEPADLVLC